MKYNRLVFQSQNLWPVMNRWAYRDDEIFSGSLSNALILRHVRQTQLSCGQRQRPSWGPSQEPSQGAILQALGKRPLSTNELTKILGLRSKTGAFKRTIKELMDRKSIEFTIPDKPNSHLQKYRLTDAGKQWNKVNLTWVSKQ